jgi:myosin-1
LEIFFNEVGTLIGGQITNYLLEKARVVGQTPGERNFHIFYQLFTDQKLCKELYLQKDPSHYEYLNKSGVMMQSSDAADFNDTRNAMKAVGMTDHEQSSVFGCIAAILHLGNLKFQKDGDKSSIQNKELLEPISRLLSLDIKQLTHGLTTRMVEVQRGGSRASTYAVGLKPEEAEFARDALAKGLYDRLFTHLINRINKSIELPKKKKTGDSKTAETLTIGILDIYGFEIFETNSFEQLNINYVNERLQQVFIELTLKMEQEEYTKEGIKWKPIPYNNNLPCVQVSLKKHVFNISSSLTRKWVFSVY